jgi:predicted GNAT family N-acyltransferase
MIKTVSFTYNDKALFEMALAIRTEVFVKEQKVDARLEFDGKDPDATHYLAYYHETPAGTARWRKTEKGIKLERFAVLPEYRSQLVGLAILDSVIKDVKGKHSYIYLNAQKSAIGFYLRYGFIAEGEPFFEAGIEHIKMILP